MQPRQIAARVVRGGRRGTHIRCQRSRFGTRRFADAVPHRPPVVGGAGLDGLMRPATSGELYELCEGVKRSFVHLETRDAYGTGTEMPHIEKWRRGEPDDSDWLDSWLDMLRRHRAAGRTCRRAKIVSEPLSEYQRWSNSIKGRFVDA